MTQDERDGIDWKLRIETTLATLVTKVENVERLLEATNEGLTSKMSRDEHKAICENTMTHIKILQRIVYGACGICGITFMETLFRLMTKQ